MQCAGTLGARNEDGTAHLDRYRQPGRLCPSSLIGLFRQGSVQKAQQLSPGTGRKGGQEFMCDGYRVSGGKGKKILEMGGGRVPQQGGLNSTDCMFKHG